MIKSAIHLICQDQYLESYMTVIILSLSVLFPVYLKKTDDFIFIP
jgi:hypothetical protein